MCTTVDKGFKVGDRCMPESFNVWAKSDEPCEVIEVERYAMRIQLPDGSADWVHPYRWNHIHPVSKSQS